MNPRIDAVADRLYGLSYRPQELALYGERVTFDLRWSPIFEDPAVSTDTHYCLAVLEIHAEVEADDEIGRAGGNRELLKIGWELELRSDTELRCDAITTTPGHVRRVLERIAETVNDLARRAGLEAPLGPAVIDDLCSGMRPDNES